MTMKHTPGPWNIYRDAIISSTKLIANVADNGVVWYVDLDEPEQEEALANARLIAAAPDLLHVAEMVLRGASDGALYGFAEAAVRKAKGEP